LAPAARLEEVRARIRAVRADLPIGEVSFAALRVARIASPAEDHPPRWLAGRKVLAFCGIGNPAAFFANLEALGAEVVSARAFGDHHGYAAAEVAALAADARAAGAEAVVTTQKDAVKL